MAFRTFSWIFSGLLSPAGEGGIYAAAIAPATVWTSSVCRDLTPACAELAESWPQALSEQTLGRRGDQREISTREEVLSKNLNRHTVEQLLEEVVSSPFPEGYEARHTCNCKLASESS